MVAFDYGNYGKLGEKSNAAELARLRKEAAEAQAAKAPNEIKKEIKRVAPEMQTAEASSNEALGLYGVAFAGMGNKKVNIVELGLPADVQAMVNKYVTPEQVMAIGSDMQKFMDLA
jgi:hypothetical protein